MIFWAARALFGAARALSATIVPRSNLQEKRARRISHFSDEELSDMTCDLSFHQGAARAATDEASLASLAHQIEEATAAAEWRREEGGASHDAAVTPRSGRA